MTIYELSLEYAQTSAALWRRIVELEQAAKTEEDEMVKHQLEGRARSLQPPKKTVGVKRGKGGRSNAHSFV